MSRFFRDNFFIAMLIKSVNGKTPQIPDDCYIAENATIVGDVSFGNHVAFGLMRLLEAM